MDLPQIRTCILRNWRGDADPIRALLAEAHELERFAIRDAPVEELRFASDALVALTVTRCDHLRQLDVDAPNLVYLNLDWMFNLDRIRFRADPARNSTRSSRNEMQPRAPPLDARL